MIIEEGKLIRGFEGLDVGDRVRVELIGTDVERGFIDFAQAGRRS
jgi:exoribonuclease-2